LIVYELQQNKNTVVLLDLHTGVWSNTRPTLIQIYLTNLYISFINSPHHVTRSRDVIVKIQLLYTSKFKLQNSDANKILWEIMLNFSL